MIFYADINTRTSSHHHQQHHYHHHQQQQQQHASPPLTMNSPSSLILICDLSDGSLVVLFVENLISTAGDQRKS
jgi:hypothetical protein